MSLVRVPDSNIIKRRLELATAKNGSQGVQHGDLLNPALHPACGVEGGGDDGCA
jgi:hypothetical protein